MSERVQATATYTGEIIGDRAKSFCFRDSATGIADWVAVSQLQPGTTMPTTIVLPLWYARKRKFYRDQ